MLAEFLSLNIFHLLLVFTRLGAAIMLFPGFSGQLVYSQHRLILAMAISLLVTPTVTGMLPRIPKTVPDLALLLLGEATIGVFFGVVVQMLLVAVNLAGTFIGFMVGLSNALVFDPVVEQQSALFTGFLGNLATVLLFATDMHHVMLRAVVDSYTLFTPGAPLPFGGFVEIVTHSLNAGFTLGLRLAAPLVVFGLIFYTGLGLISKLAPTIPAFLIGMPMQILFGLWIFMIALPSFMMLFIRSFADGLLQFLAPG